MIQKQHMNNLICCRKCIESSCEGCNMYELSIALDKGYFNLLKDDKNSIHINSLLRENIEGKWISVSPFTDTLQCSHCGYNIIDEEFITPYCPICSADLR